MGGERVAKEIEVNRELVQVTEEEDWLSLRAQCMHVLIGRHYAHPGVGVHQWEHVKQTWSIPGLLHAIPECVPAAAGPPGERLRVLPLLCECARQSRPEQGPQQQDFRTQCAG